MKEITIKKCLVPIEDQLCPGGLPAPEFKEFNCITFQEVKIGKKVYGKYEYIPHNIDLCEGGNAVRKGSKIILKDKKKDA